MKNTSGRLSVTPVGRVAARSVIHPKTAIQLIEYSSEYCDRLLAISQAEEDDKLRFIFLHAIFASDEYSSRFASRFLPYQLDNLVQNKVADETDEILIESPWKRNAKAANAAMVASRWAEGLPMDRLQPEFASIGSGLLQGLFRDAADVLHSWADCLRAAALKNVVEDDRPPQIRNNDALCEGLRNLSAIIRINADTIRWGLPGDVAWMAGLTSENIGQPILRRSAILALRDKGLNDPIDILKHDAFSTICETLKEQRVSRIDDVAKEFRDSVRLYRNSRREALWNAALRRAEEPLKDMIKETKESRGKEFERCIENMLKLVGLGHERLDDGTVSGAPDLLIGLNHKNPVVVELKSALGDGGVGLNEATDVIRGAAIADRSKESKCTLANPGFDPNVPWQTRNVQDLSLIEACQFVFGIVLLANNDVDKEQFLAWLSQPGLLSVGDISDDY